MQSKVEMQVSSRSRQADVVGRTTWLCLLNSAICMERRCTMHPYSWRHVMPAWRPTPSLTLLGCAPLTFSSEPADSSRCEHPFELAGSFQPAEGLSISAQIKRRPVSAQSRSVSASQGLVAQGF